MGFFIPFSDIEDHLVIASCPTVPRPMLSNRILHVPSGSSTFGESTGSTRKSSDKRSKRISEVASDKIGP